MIFSEIWEKRNYLKPPYDCLYFNAYQKLRRYSKKKENCIENETFRKFVLDKTVGSTSPLA